MTSLKQKYNRNTDSILQWKSTEDLLIGYQGFKNCAWEDLFEDI